MHVMHYVNPWTSLLVSSEENVYSGGFEGAKKGLQYSLERNFGELEFDWEERSVTIRSIGEDYTYSSSPLLSAQVKMDQLLGRIPMPNAEISEEDFSEEEALFDKFSSRTSDWTCIQHRGRVSMLQEFIGPVNTVVSLVSVFTVPILLPAYVVTLIWKKKRRSRSCIRPSRSFSSTKPLRSRFVLDKQLSI
jgi:hypothetical protein